MPLQQSSSMPDDVPMADLQSGNQTGPDAAGVGHQTQSQRISAPLSVG